MSLPEQFAKWKVVPREEIDWYPVVDEDKCTGCCFCNGRKNIKDRKFCNRS